MHKFALRTAILALACLTWVAVAAAPAPLLTPSNSIAQPPSPPVTPSKTIAQPPSPPVQEDCMFFNRNNLTVKLSGSEHTVMDASHRLFYFHTAANAANAVNTIRKYGFNRICFVGRPFSAGSGMTYLLP